MNIGTVLVVGVPIVVAVLTWMDFKLDGPRLVARLWARIQAPRKEREELRRTVDEHANTIGGLIGLSVEHSVALSELSKQVKELQVDVQMLYAPEEGNVLPRLDALERKLKSLESRTITSLPPSTSKRAKQTETTGGPVRGPLTWEQHLQAADAMARRERERADVKELATSLEQAFSEENRPVLQYPAFTPGQQRE